MEKLIKKNNKKLNAKTPHYFKISWKKGFSFAFTYKKKFLILFSLDFTEK